MRLRVSKLPPQFHRMAGGHLDTDLVLLSPMFPRSGKQGGERVGGLAYPRYGNWFPSASKHHLPVPTECGACGVPRPAPAVHGAAAAGWVEMEPAWGPHSGHR